MHNMPTFDILSLHYNYTLDYTKKQVKLKNQFTIEFVHSYTDNAPFAHHY